MKAVLVVLALMRVIYPSVASAQTAPAAPPPITGTLVIPATCLDYDVNLALLVGNSQRQAATLAVMSISKPGNQWVADCSQGILTFAQTSEPPVPIPQPAINLANVGVQVWTADDSQKQFNFLRAEVKSTIETAVTNKVVNSTIIQNAVTRAIEDKQTLQEAITAAVNTQLEKLKDDIVKEVLLKLQQKPNTPQATQTPAQ
jgi:hypothetical protein